MNNKEDNYKLFIEEICNEKGVVKNKPVQLMFGLTNVCNLHCAFCPYCGFCMAKIEMVKSIPIELIKEIKPFLSAAKFINPSGRGEPLLYSNIEDFIDVCRECDALNAMQLTNNGTQLGRIDLEKLNGVNIIAVSIDSVDTRTFEILRYGAKLDGVLNNVKKVREKLPDTTIQWCVVVNRLNIDQLSDIYLKAREYGVNYITYNDVYGYEEDRVINLLRLREADRNIVEEQFEKINLLNNDNKLVVNNVISWSGFEDGQKIDKEEIFRQLEELKNQKPYLDFDAINCEDFESRRIKTEKKCGQKNNKVRIPYCTNPFEVMFIQPDLSVSPCCASYGTIDKICDNDVERVWNGERYKALREAMFDYDMLPDYCKKCEAFMRYDYIDDWWKKTKETFFAQNGRELRYDDLVFPPNFFPPEGKISNTELMNYVHENNKKGCLKMDNKELVTENINKFVCNMVDRKTVLDNGPIQLIIGLTNVCNLRCSFCLYCGFCMEKIDKSDSLSFEAINKLKPFLEKASIVIPSGRGEPLVYKDFDSFIEVCNETNAISKMQLITNGTFLDKYDTSLFDGINILSISFDSAQKDIFELLRYGSDYNRIVNNIEKIREALPNLVIQLSVTINRLNMEEMTEIYKLGRKLGVNYISYNSLYGYSEDKVIQLLRLREHDKKIIDDQLEKIHKLNEDGKIEVINVITFDQFDDGEEYNKEKIFSELEKLKEIKPYLNYDKLEMGTIESRRVKIENRGGVSGEDIRLPYCTNPFSVLLMQPNQDYSPCCASFGRIGNMESCKCVDEAWNGENFVLMREAMFNYSMLPDYCKKCKTFTRYDYINEYIDALKVKGEFDYSKVIIPPNYNPPKGLIKDPEIEKLVEARKNDENYYELLRLYEEQNRIVEKNAHKDEYIVQAQELCNHFATGKLMRLNHFMFRLKGEFLKGGKEERKEFCEWLKGKIKGTNKAIGKGYEYNPWMVVYNKLNEARGLLDNNTGIVGCSEGAKLTDNTKQILAEEYKKYDVIILSVIDYNFRFQRPQHFAKRFAENGHRVFYVNANFVRPDLVANTADNLFTVDFSYGNCNAIYGIEGEKESEWMKEKIDNLFFSQAIRDAVVIVDYPNWLYCAEYIREKYGFKIVTDYMDDYTGFLGTTEDYLKDNCVKLLKSSDLVVSSSNFLHDVASKYTSVDKIEIIRNGTEVEHFYKAVNLRGNAINSRKIIGYYGAVSHWFAWEKVCYIAKTHPECDVVIVGDVTDHREKLEKYENIKLLGEKPYAELPKYLADFDVCLIPFDTSTDLIKATNPVKFYEYLSAGKKIVATEIPELEPFRDEYVYMSNDDAEFAKYVDICLEGKDSLKGPEECIAFAGENDWQKRYEVFEKNCKKAIPTVSIIVLTYNNLQINKDCIRSILEETAYGNYELIIVDNASTDGTKEYLSELKAKNISNVKVILNDTNLGFACGNNIGINEASGKYVVLLNNDTVISRGWLTALVKHLENNDGIGMCNPVTNSIGNESKIRAKYTNMQEMREFAYSITGKNMNHLYGDVDRLPLFATIIRKDAIDKVGLLDEEYKIGMFEDDDYAERIKHGGYRIVIADDSFVHHINNGSFSKMQDSEYRKIFESNKAIYEKKWNKKWNMPKYRKGVDADCNNDIRI